MQCCVTKASDYNYEEVIEINTLEELIKFVIDTRVDVIIDCYDKHGTACEEGTFNIRIRD